MTLGLAYDHFKLNISVIHQLTHGWDTDKTARHNGLTATKIDTEDKGISFPVGERSTLKG